MAVNDCRKRKCDWIAVRACKTLRAKVYVEIFGLEAPLRHKEPFNSAAHSPSRNSSAARRCIGGTRTGEEDGVGERWVCKRNAASREEQPRAVGNADSPPNCRQPMAAERFCEWIDGPVREYSA